MKSVACMSDCEKGHLVTSLMRAPLSAGVEIMSSTEDESPSSSFFNHSTTQEEGGVFRLAAEMMRISKRPHGVEDSFTCNGLLATSLITTFTIHSQYGGMQSPFPCMRRKQKKKSTFAVSTHLQNERRAPTKVLQSERS